MLFDQLSKGEHHGQKATIRGEIKPLSDHLLPIPFLIMIIYRVYAVSTVDLAGSKSDSIGGHHTFSFQYPLNG